ncbi:MAG TPA: SMC family ATPase [Thermoanaerobaculia bacterium]|nr:SMC family ATPase [Thermoanaerobaculia bacterium]
MRPIRLVIQGLRSYRQRQDIDFTGAGLIAIVGDTGAGKSSILEGLCVALYAASTWEKKNVKALISSGMSTLDVDLVFEAEGKRWRVHRSLPAGNYPPAIHWLVGESDGTRLDGAREVNDRIVALVGLDYDAFLRAVLLPQGRFQALLQATGGERTSILKGIFRLDLLERVRESATACTVRIEPRLTELRLRRSKLFDDPRAVAEAAERGRVEAEREQARLSAAAAEVRTATSTADDLRRGAVALDKAAQAAKEHDPAPRIVELRALIEREEELATRRTTLTARQVELEGERGDLATRVRDAEASGHGYEALLGATRTLDELVQWMARAEREVAAVESDRREVAARAERLESLRRELAALDESLVASRSEVETARAERERALKELEDGRQRLAAARTAAGLVSERKEALAAREREHARAAKELEGARRAAVATGKTLRVAEDAVASAQRRHAAVHAAAGVGPGDPCPVCDRKLPPRWKAPAAADHARAESAAKKAQVEERAAREQVAKLETSAAGLERRVTEDHSALETARTKLEDTVALLRQIAGKSASAAGEGDAPLRALSQRAAASSARLEEAQRQREKEERSRSERHGVVERLGAEVKAKREQVDGAQTRLERERKERLAQLAKLPSSVRAAELEAIALAAALERAGKALDVAKNTRARQEKLATELQTVQRELRQVDELLHNEIRRPTVAAARTLDQLRHALDALAGEVEGEAPPRSDAEAPAEVAAWARELGESRDRLLRGVAARAKQVEQKLAAAEKAARDALSRAGHPSAEALTERATEVAVTLRRATEDVATARRQIVVAAELDRRIAVGAPLVESLRELARLLTDGKFIAHVVERKQRSLLVVASALLGEMTRNRYGFSEDFQVVDRLAGEPRSVMTLSGGESFLASLALALALVELAGREGGRLDALFLDEGFGSLDASALAEALEALGEQAAKGRMVAVISHLRAVAENIDKVLFVSPTPAGSHATWLSESDRERLVEHEAMGLLG